MIVESFAQLFLKIGAGGGPGLLSFSHGRSAGALIRVPLAVWVSLGVAAYGLEICLYTLALHYLEVSTAFPFGSLCFVGVALLSKLLLGETVGKLRWLGIGCILAGTIALTL